MICPMLSTAPQPQRMRHHSVGNQAGKHACLSFGNGWARAGSIDSTPQRAELSERTLWELVGRPGRALQSGRARSRSTVALGPATTTTASTREAIPSYRSAYACALAVRTQTQTRAEPRRRGAARGLRGSRVAPQVANSIDESTFNQIASKPEAQSKILRLLDELAVHYQTLWGLGGNP